MVRISTRLLTLVATVLLVMACGGSSDTSSSSSSSPNGGRPTLPSLEKNVASVDACTLVTQDEASAAVGAPMTNLGSTGGVQIPGACIYGASGSSDAVFVFAQVYPDTTTADAVQPDTVAAALAGRLGVTNAHTVNGIGDKAFEYGATGTAGGGIAIFVFRYNVVMMIAVDPTSDSGKVEQLARNAVSRLVTS
jgi:hypothetical protein